MDYRYSTYDSRRRVNNNDNNRIKRSEIVEHLDWILYILFFVGAFFLVLAGAELFGLACIKIIERRVFKRHYNSNTREYK